MPDTCLLIMYDDQIHLYGNSGMSRDEFLFFPHLSTNIQCLTIDANSVFSISVFLCQIFASLTFLLTSGSFLYRIVNTLKSFFSYNFFLFGAWLLQSSSMQTAKFDILDEYVKSFCLSHDSYHFKSLVIRNYHHRTSLFLLISFAVFFYTSVKLLKRVGFLQVDENGMSSISDMLMLDSNRTTTTTATDNDNFINRRWIEQLATPISLWLQPLVSNDYIDQLPVWKHSSQHSSDDDDDDVSSGRCSPLTEPPRITSGFHHKLLRCIRRVLARRRSPFRYLDRAPAGMRITSTCSICLERYKPNADVCGLPCHHVFHRNCILSWLPDNHACPMCRWPSYRPQ